MKIELAIPKEQYDAFFKKVSTFYFQCDEPVLTRHFRASDSDYVFASFETDCYSDIMAIAFMLPDGCPITIKSQDFNDFCVDTVHYTRGFCEESKYHGVAYRACVL